MPHEADFDPGNAKNVTEQATERLRESFLLRLQETLAIVAAGPPSVQTTQNLAGDLVNTVEYAS